MASKIASVNDQASCKMDLAIAFKKIDVDGSGGISKEELWSRISGQGDLGVSETDFDVIFGIIDKDKSGTIDLAEYSLFMEQVRKINGGNKRRRSSLKVPTLEDSLSSCGRPKLKKNKSRQSSRSSKLFRSHIQKAFKGKNLNLDESLPKIAPEERPTTLRFFDVEVREYGLTVSDNPGVRTGVAVELSWDYNVLERNHLDTFEARRSTERSENFKKEKKLTRLEREKVLKEFGATQKEIEDAAKRSAVIRNKRKKSISLRKQDKFHEDVENRMTSMKNLFRRGSRKSNPENEMPDLDRLHPTLIALMEAGADGGSQHSTIGE